MKDISKIPRNMRIGGSGVASANGGEHKTTGGKTPATVAKAKAALAPAPEKKRPAPPPKDDDESEDAEDTSDDDAGSDAEATAPSDQKKDKKQGAAAPKAKRVTLAVNSDWRREHPLVVRQGVQAAAEEVAAALTTGKFDALGADTGTHTLLQIAQRNIALASSDAAVRVTATTGALDAARDQLETHVRSVLDHLAVHAELDQRGRPSARRTIDPAAMAQAIAAANANDGWLDEAVDSHHRVLRERNRQTANKRRETIAEKKKGAAAPAPKVGK